MWERRNWWVFIACLVLLVACESTYTLKHTGRVTDRASRLPLAGVEVHLVVDGITHTAFTDNVGSYGFEIQVSASNASGVVVVLLDGYEPYDRNLSLSESLSSYEDIRLEVSTANGILPSTVEVVEANPQPEADAPDTPEAVEPTVTATPEHTATPTTPPTATITPQPTNTPTATNTPQPTNTLTATQVPATPTPRPPTPTLSPQAGDPWVRPTDNMTMRFVPGGTFPMGSEDGADDERPVHDVTLNPFWIDQTEVTNFQYTQCVQAEECEPSSYATDADFNGAQQPVVGVSWYDAEAYCAWAEARLPTEAEWEYAARGREGRVYPWGDTFDGTKANFCDENCTYDWRDETVDDGYELTSTVGEYSPAGDSWVGAQDMAGNVWDWVADWYGGDYYNSAPADNPTGPASGIYKVLRGGSWSDHATFLRSAYRLYYNPTGRYILVGFRCVRPGP